MASSPIACLGPRPLRCALWTGVLVALAAGCLLLLFTCHNRFPFFYHPDEPDKVEQVMTAEWNFHHPLLLLAVSRVASKVLTSFPDEQTIVILGRCISAIFATIAVVALACLAAIRKGPVGFLCVGFLLGLHHQVFDLAHFMKEDAALLMGLSLGFLSLALHWNRPSIPRLIFLGCACGLSLSAKYIGILFLLPAFLVIILAQRRRRIEGSEGPGLGASLLIFLGSFFAIAAVANYPLLCNLEVFRNSFHREVALVNEKAGRVAFFEYLKIFKNNTNFVLWVLLGVHLGQQWRNRSKLSPTQWVETLFPFLFMAILSCSQKTNDRYFLPATALFTYLAGLGICDLADLLKERGNRWFQHRGRTLGLCLGVACLFQVIEIPVLNPNSLGESFHAFQNDDRADLIQWVRSNLPASAVIAQDNRVALPTPTRPVRLKVQGLLEQKVIDTKLVANLGSMQDLRTQGITHVIVSESDYGKFFRKSWVARNADDARKKQFYLDLFQRGNLLWERPRDTVIYLHPGLKLYQLPL